MTAHPPRRLSALHLACVLLATCLAARAQIAPAHEPGIYTCLKDGRPLRSDRPIPECADREQRILNRDGSLKKVLPPPLTPDERVAREEQERRSREEQAGRKDAQKSDQNMMKRYRDEAAHDQARSAALEPVLRATKSSQARLDQLAAERVPLINEAEFYRGKKLPAALKQLIEANDAAVAAQRDAIRTQEAESLRINQNFDAQQERLRRLWQGAPPGSLGPALR